MGKSLVSCFLTHGVVQADISFSLMRFASPLARSCLADTSSLYGKERRERNVWPSIAHGNTVHCSVMASVSSASNYFIARHFALGIIQFEYFHAATTKLMFIS